MEKLLRKSLVIPFLFMAFGLLSCDDDDWRMEERLVGEWVYYYEDRDMIEEERFVFTPDGRWSSTYYYSDVWGKRDSRIDGGYFEVDYGRLKLYSNYFDDILIFDVEFRGNRLYLWDGNVELEYIRYR